MYAFTVEVPLPIDQAIERLKATLAAEKIGIVSEINAQEVLKTKIDYDIGPFRVLGACAPGIARRVLDTDRDMGAMLPCGVAVYALAPDRTRIAIQDPLIIAGVTDRPEIRNAMAEIRTAIERAVHTLAQAG